MMREIRDDLSREMKGMSFEEQKKYIEGKVKPKSKIKKSAKKKEITKVIS
jgi:hypothetical protein